MSTLSLAAVLLCAASLFGVLNHRFLKLPRATGLTITALFASLVILGLDRWRPELGLRRWSERLVGSGALPQVLLNGALSLLLFAGSLEIHLSDLRERWRTVLILVTIGVAMAAALFAAGIWKIFALLGVQVPLVWCLVLGAILAPTDPVAVGAVMRRVDLPRTLQTVITGESLLNDGVAVVVFTAALHAATRGHVTAYGMALDFARQAFGAIALGFVTGWAAYWLMRGIDEYRLEVMISLALATGTYVLANAIGVSGPISVVVAGLLIGNRGTKYAMSETTRTQLRQFWLLIDELLNAVLFLLIGFELLSLQFHRLTLLAALASIPLALLVRALSVVLPTYWLHVHTPKKWSGAAMLTWGGLRGGISVALALTLPDTPWRAMLLGVCYGVVVFTIAVQGATLERLARAAYRERPA